MSQVYSTYTGAKPVEQPAPGDGQEWLSCEVCSLTFKNQQHYSIHCGGTFHANRVAASLRTQQTSAKGGLKDQQGFGSSTNPSYWTGMQQAFSFAGAQQHDPQKSANRPQGGQGQLNTTAEAYQSQLEYISYPVGKQAKQSSDSKTTGGYEGLYGMPGFGWSDMQPDSSSKPGYQLQQYPANAQIPELQQVKGSSSSKPAASHDAWKNYQPETGRVLVEKGFESKKPPDYGYSAQDLSVASYASQKSDVPSWMKILEPAVQKPESYRSSNKAALYGSHDPFSNDASTRGTERDDPWKSTPNYEADVRGQMRHANEGSYGKTEQPLRSKTRWDTDDSSGREAKQRSGDDPNRQGSEGRRREERDSNTKGSYRDSRESSSSRNNEDSYCKRDSGRWEDARERDSFRRKQESDVRDGTRRNDDLSYKEMPFGTKRSTGTREIGAHAAVGKGKEDSGAWDSSYTGAVSSSGYMNQHRDQGFAIRTAGKQDVPQFEQTEWKPESWGAYDPGWQAKAPEAASSHGRKALAGAETLNQKTSFDQQRKTSWGGAAVQGKTDAAWMQAEGSDVWNAAYVSATGGGVVPWSGTPGYTSAGLSSKDGRNEKTLARGRGAKGSWNQKEVEKNSSSQLLHGGNTWPIASSGHGLGGNMQYDSGAAGDQEWHSVDNVLAKFKQASKKPGQKSGADIGSSAYGDHLNQGLGSYTTRPSPTGKPGQKTLDPTGRYDWNWTGVAEDNQQELGESYNEQEFSGRTVPYHQGVSSRGGSYSTGRGGFLQPGLRDANSAGQKVAQVNQWTAWPNTEQRGSGAFAKDQQSAGQTVGMGRGQSGFQETKSLGRGVGFGRSELKGIQKPVGLIRSVQKGDRAEKEDWAQPFSHGGQGLLGKAPGASSGVENAGRGGGRGVFGNRPTPQPGEIGGWRQSFQGKLNVSAGRGGPIRGSESSLGQKNSSWGFGGPGVKLAAASLTKGFEKGQEGKASSNLQEKMRQLSEQGLAWNWNEKGRDSQESNPVRTPVAGAGQSNSAVAAAGQRTNQSSSVPSLLNLNVAPTGISQKSDRHEDKYSRDATDSKQKSSDVVQPPSSAFSGKKPEQSSGRMSGSAATLPATSSSRQESVVPSSGRSISSNLNKPLPQQQAVQPAAASVSIQKALTPKQPLLPMPSMSLQSQNKQSASVESAAKKPSGPVVKATGGPGDFDRLDPASARKTCSAGDNKQKVTVVGSSSSVVVSQASVMAKQTGVSNIAPSKEAATNITSSASKLDSKVTPAAAAEAKIGLKSSDSQLRGNGPSGTCSSSATAIKPQPAAQASSTGDTPRLDSSNKPVAQKNIPVGPRNAKKEDLDNDDECDPALSEALGQFFSEGKDVPTETVKPENPAKKTAAGSTKFVPTIRTYAVKSLAGFSKEDHQSGKKSDSSGDNTKTAEQPKKALPAAITVKVEKDDSSILSGTGDGQKAEGKAGDPIAKLSKLLPPNLMKGIASGHLSKELLEKVADLLPADVLKQAVDYLQGSGAVQQTATETPELQQKVQLPGVSVDVASKARVDEEMSQAKAIVDATKKAGKPADAPSRVQVIQPRKGLPNPAALGSTNAKGPAASSSVKTPLDVAGNNKDPGTLVSVTKPPVQGSVVPSKRKYDDIDPAKLKNLNVDEMMKLFQELLQDVLGSLFEEDQKPSSAISEKRLLDSLSVEDREMALKVRQMTGITDDLSRIIHTMNILKSLNSETIQALGQLDKSIIVSSLTGNERAQKMGVTILHQITELMAKPAPDSKQMGISPPVPVGRGRGSVRPPQPGSSSGGRGVQSLLTLNFMEAPKPGALSAGLASAARPLLPTPRFPQQPRFTVDSMMAARGLGLLPTPPDQGHMQNIPRPFLRKRGPLQSDELYGSGPPMKRWR